MPAMFSKLTSSLCSRRSRSADHASSFRSFVLLLLLRRIIEPFSAEVGKDRVEVDVPRHIQADAVRFVRHLVLDAEVAHRADEEPRPFREAVDRQLGPELKPFRV